MIILGAGFTGLLAGCVFKDAIIYEHKTKEECRMKHQALLRMKTNKIGEFLGIRFKKVQVNKSIWYGEKNVGPTPDMIHMYSKKVSGTISNRSISNIDSEIRYIPPENFYDVLWKKSCQVAFNKSNLWNNEWDDQIINTLPLQEMLQETDSMHTMIGNIHHKSIYVTKFKIKDCDSHATIYYPSDLQKVYRATLNGDILIIESIDPLEASDGDFGLVFNSLGINENDLDGELLINHKQEVGKMVTIDNKIRSKLILDLTLKHNIYSLGRVATWRTKLMLDDVLDDIFVIRKLMERGNYASVLYNHDVEI